ncbi:MAG: DEAD/DEAH box helicase family protein [Bacilli bacterium]|nr:DEAD/DEAH box helicase family protein [Bacilli bacterium]MBN2697138.1 DEAD/DEAH box helicase family protein [Bacilli bacterium]
MSIKSVKLPIFISRSEEGSYEKNFLPFLRTAEIMEIRVHTLHFDWIQASKDYLLQFIDQGGKIRMIVALDLEEDERNHFLLHHDEQMEEIIKKYILDPFKREFPYHEQWLIRYLAYLIVSSTMQIRISVPKQKDGRRDQIVFLSENKDRVCFHGAFISKASCVFNDSIDVFVSWDQRDNIRIQEYKRQFEDEWRNRLDSSWVVDVPSLVMDEFKALQDDYNPYRYLLENKSKYKLRSYHQEAIDNLALNNWRGTFILPVGSGKIISTLFALDQYILTYPRTVVLITAPNLIALQEWEKTIRNKYPTKQVFNLLTDQDLAEQEIGELIRLKLREDFVFFLTTYRTFLTSSFQSTLKKNKNYTFYIFDEYHLMAGKNIKMNLTLLEEGARVGLSSLNDSWLNDKDRRFILDNFGISIVDYPVQNQIGKTLNEYDYHVFLSELIVSEYSEFRQLTSLHLRAEEKRKETAKPVMEDFLLQRERVVEKAYNKLQDFLGKFHSLPKKGVIVYVDHNHIEETKNAIEFEFRVKVDVLTSELSVNDRNRLFRNFQSGNIDVLITHDAFDEGIENLNVNAIYLLASPTSPRIFFKRRDRVLYDKNPKLKVSIYDFVTIAPRQGMHDLMQVEVIKRELPRVSEFMRLARKNYIDELQVYIDELNLSNVLQNAEPADLNQDIYVKSENLIE